MTLPSIRSGIVPQISLDRPRFRAIVVTALNGAYALDNLESVQTNKSDNGDAGTFSFSFPLGDPISLLAVRAMGPMDLIAIFADRVTSADANDYFIGQNLHVDLLTYGDPTASTVNAFQGVPSCIMVGMIDTVDEETDFEAARATCDVSGRDLTKIFIDNDTIAPFTDPSGSPAMTNMYNLLLRQATSGRQFLLDILRAFVKKERQFIEHLSVGQPSAQSTTAYATVASDYGYNWDYFVTSQYISGKNLDSGAFLHFKGSTWLPNFAVQASSCWAAIQELRNRPLTRLFVTETGALIFDDQWTAWGFGQTKGFGISGAVNASDVRHAKFSVTDEDFVTAITMMPTVVATGLQALSSHFQVLRPFQKTLTAIKQYGYRWLRYQAPWSGATTGVDKDFLQSLEAKALVLDEMHNNMPRMMLTLKGRSDIKAGSRITCTYKDQSGNVLWGPITAAIRPADAVEQVWYVERVSHSFTFGNDWSTTVECRFPYPKGSPTV